MLEVKNEKKIADTMTIGDALTWQAMGYELLINNGEVTGIIKRKVPHVGES